MSGRKRKSSSDVAGTVVLFKVLRLRLKMFLYFLCLFLYIICVKSIINLFVHVCQVTSVVSDSLQPFGL